MTLSELIHTAGVTIDDIASFLDALNADERRQNVLALNKADQIALWEKSADAPPLDASHYVPAGTGALQEVVHSGRNTLPFFKLFEKRFAVAAPGDAEAFGYNEGASRPLIGPGYFVAQPTAGNPEWEAISAFVVNYYRVPQGPVVEGWPKVVPNSSGLQMFVYNKTRDFMRRVSEHVSIGAAYKADKPMGAYFVLVREPAE